MIISVRDNGGKTADRYTVKIGKFIFTMSEDADQPQGVDMLHGDMRDTGAKFDYTCGKLCVKFSLLPSGTRRAIARRAGLIID